jgi:hypothetical protein
LHRHSAMKETIGRSARDRCEALHRQAVSCEVLHTLGGVRSPGMPWRAQGERRCRESTSTLRQPPRRERTGTHRHRRAAGRAAVATRRASRGESCPIQASRWWRVRDRVIKFARQLGGVRRRLARRRARGCTIRREERGDTLARPATPSGE